MRTSWNQLASQDWYRHIGTIDFRHLKEDKGHFPWLETQDFFLYEKFLLEGYWVTPFLPDTKKRDEHYKYLEQNQKEVADILENYDLDRALGIIGWYPIMEYWNNIVTQESPTYCTVKNLWGKATSKELVYTLTNMRLESDTNGILDHLWRNDKNGPTPHEVYKSLEKKEKRKLRKQYKGSQFDELENIKRIFPLWIQAVSAHTVQEAVEHLKKILGYNKFWKIFLEELFDRVQTEEQKKNFSLKDDIQQFNNETPEEAMHREAGEESWYYWQSIAKLWYTVEIKRTSCKIPEINKQGIAIKYRFYDKFVYQWYDNKLKKLSPSEKDQQLMIRNDRGLLETLEQSIAYSNIKLWVKNYMPHDEETIIKSENRLEKVNSHIANGIGLTLWLLHDWKTWRVTKEETRKNKSLYWKKLKETYWMSWKKNYWTWW